MLCPSLAVSPMNGRLDRRNRLCQRQEAREGHHPGRHVEDPAGLEQAPGLAWLERAETVQQRADQIRINRSLEKPDIDEADRAQDRAVITKRDAGQDAGHAAHEHPRREIHRAKFLPLTHRDTIHANRRTLVRGAQGERAIRRSCNNMPLPVFAAGKPLFVTGRTGLAVANANPARAPIWHNMPSEERQSIRRRQNRARAQFIVVLRSQTAHLHETAARICRKSLGTHGQGRHAWIVQSAPGLRRSQRRARSPLRALPGWRCRSPCCSLTQQPRKSDRSLGWALSSKCQRQVSCMRGTFHLCASIA